MPNDVSNPKFQPAPKIVAVKPLPKITNTAVRSPYNESKPQAL